MRNTNIKFKLGDTVCLNNRTVGIIHSFGKTNAKVATYGRCNDTYGSEFELGYKYKDFDFTLVPITKLETPEQVYDKIIMGASYTDEQKQEAKEHSAKMIAHFQAYYNENIEFSNKIEKAKKKLAKEKKCKVGFLASMLKDREPYTMPPKRKLNIGDFIDLGRYLPQLSKDYKDWGFSNLVIGFITAETETHYQIKADGYLHLPIFREPVKGWKGASTMIDIDYHHIIWLPKFACEIELAGSSSAPRQPNIVEYEGIPVYFERFMNEQEFADYVEKQRTVFFGTINYNYPPSRYNNLN